MEAIKTQQIRELRLKKNWTQLDLALKVGITEQAINRIETGKVTPRPSTMSKIEMALSENSDKKLPQSVPNTFGDHVEASLVISRLEEANARLLEENRRLGDMVAKSQTQIDSLLTLLAKPKGSLQTRSGHLFHRSKMGQVSGQVTLTPARRG